MSGGHPTAADGAARGNACVRVLPAVLSAGARCGSPVAAVSRVDVAQPSAGRSSAVLGGVRVWWMEVPNPVSSAPVQVDGELYRSQPHTLAGAAAGPRGPAAAANLASMHQCVVKALDARPLSSCGQPGKQLPGTREELGTTAA